MHLDFFGIIKFLNKHQKKADNHIKFIQNSVKLKYKTRNAHLETKISVFCFS